MTSWEEERHDRTIELERESRSVRNQTDDRSDVCFSCGVLGIVVYGIPGQKIRAQPNDSEGKHS